MPHSIFLDNIIIKTPKIIPIKLSAKVELNSKPPPITAPVNVGVTVTNARRPTAKNNVPNILNSFFIAILIKGKHSLKIFRLNKFLD